LRGWRSYNDTVRDIPKYMEGEFTAPKITRPILREREYRARQLRDRREILTSGELPVGYYRHDRRFVAPIVDKNLEIQKRNLEFVSSFDLASRGGSQGRF